MADITGTHYVISRWDDKGRSYYGPARNWTQDNTQAYQAYRYYQHWDKQNLRGFYASKP